MPVSSKNAVFSTMQDSRLEQLHQWAERELGHNVTIVPVSGDASFRRYFRVTGDNACLIAMDAPPDKENSEPFVRINRLLEAQNIHVPHIQAQDLEQGFMLLEDFGDVQLLSQLNDDSVDKLYGDALDTLFDIQTGVSADDLPAYDEPLLEREMILFTEWFLGKHLDIALDDNEIRIIMLTFNTLITNALEQPKVFVHRDYHSRNLMHLSDAEKTPGVIDFQDAVNGPITYDLVSLLRDCYISWPREQVEAWVARYHQRCVDAGLTDADGETFQRWFDLMGIQRHLKAIGIFARLNHRDGKTGYLNDIPRTLDYVIDVAKRYEVLMPFVAVLIRLQVKQKLEKVA